MKEHEWYITWWSDVDGICLSGTDMFCGTKTEVKEFAEKIKKLFERGSCQVSFYKEIK